MTSLQVSRLAAQDAVWRGQATLDLLEGSPLCLAAEKLPLDEVMFVYYYFTADYNVSAEKDFSGGLAIDLIQRHKILWGRARCLTDDALRASLLTEHPHYGDGVYITCHEDLASAVLPVKRAHGVDVARRHYRAVYEVLNHEQMRKYEQTGGVMRWLPTEPPECGRKFKLRADGEHLRYVRTEQLINGGWRTMEAGRGLHD